MAGGPATSLLIDYGEENVGLAVHRGLVAFSTPIPNSVSLYLDGVPLNIMSSDALDTSPDAMRGPARIAFAPGTNLLLVAEFGNRWARLVDLGESRGELGAAELATFRAGGLGVFAVAIGFGQIAVCGRSEEPADADTDRVHVYDSRTYEFVRSYGAPASCGAQWNAPMSCQFVSDAELLITLRGARAPVLLQLATGIAEPVLLSPPLDVAAKISAAVFSPEQQALYVATIDDGAVRIFHDGVQADVLHVPAPNELCLDGGCLHVLSAETNNARVLSFGQFCSAE